MRRPSARRKTGNRGNCRKSSSPRKNAPKTSRTFRSACRRSAELTCAEHPRRRLRRHHAHGARHSFPGPVLDRGSITSRFAASVSTSGSATVGIYIDEVSVTVSNSQYDGAVQPKLFDLDRIEVLRGPQGTLYGASSMGGTIRFISKQPDLHSFKCVGSAPTCRKTHHGGFQQRRVLRF